MLDPSDLTLRQAAVLTKYSVRSLRRWVHDGRLPALRVGPPGTKVSRIVIRRSDLEAFLCGHGPEDQ